MHDLEQRAQRLVQDWKTLRQELEQLQRKERLGQFYTVHLDLIEASLIEVPELIYCAVSDINTPGIAEATPVTTQPHTHTPQPLSEGGFAVLIRRARQAVEEIDMDEWS